MPTAPEVSTHRRPRLLLVDDYRPNLTALEATLASDDWDLITADSGPHALRQVLDDQPPFSVIILDVAMPGMSGFEVAELLQHTERTRYIPILFITAKQADKQSVYRGYSVGAVDYITKPFDPRILLAKVRLLVDLHEHAESLRREAQRLRSTGGNGTDSEAAAIARRPVHASLPKDLPALVFVLSPSGTIDESMGTLARFEGFGSGAQLINFAHPEDQANVKRSIGEGVATDRFEVEARFRDRETGKWHWLLVRGKAERDEHGELLCWLGVGVDVDSQKRALDENVQLLIREQAARRASVDASERAALEADAAELAMQWTEPEALLSRLARLLLERVGDWCAIDLVRGDALERVAVLHRDRTWATTAAQLEGTRRRRTVASLPLGRALAGEPILSVGTAQLLASSIGADEETVGRLGARSWVMVPLSSGRYVAGVLTVACAAGREQLGEADLRALERIGRRIGTTIVNSIRETARRELAEAKDVAMAAAARALAEALRQGGTEELPAGTARLERLSHVDPDVVGARGTETAESAVTRIASELGAHVQTEALRGEVLAATAPAVVAFLDAIGPVAELEATSRDGFSDREPVAEALVLRVTADVTRAETGDRVKAAAFSKAVLERIGARVETTRGDGHLSCSIEVPLAVEPPTPMFRSSAVNRIEAP